MSKPSRAFAAVCLCLAVLSMPAAARPLDPTGGEHATASLWERAVEIWRALGLPWPNTVPEEDVRGGSEPSEGAPWATIGSPSTEGDCRGGIDPWGVCLY